MLRCSLSVEEVGRAIAGYKDPGLSRGVGIGALWRALVCVANFYRREATLGSGDALTASERNMKRQIQAGRRLD